MKIDRAVFLALAASLAVAACSAEESTDSDAAEVRGTSCWSPTAESVSGPGQAFFVRELGFDPVADYPAAEAFCLRYAFPPNTQEGGSGLPSNTQEGGSGFPSNTQEGGSGLPSNTQEGGSGFPSNTQEGGSGELEFASRSSLAQKCTSYAKSFVPFTTYQTFFRIKRLIVPTNASARFEKLYEIDRDLTRDHSVCVTPEASRLCAASSDPICKFVASQMKPEAQPKLSRCLQSGFTVFSCTEGGLL